MFVLVSLSEKKNGLVNTMGLGNTGQSVTPHTKVLPSFCSHEQQFKELSHSFFNCMDLSGVTNICVYKL